MMDQLRAGNRRKDQGIALVLVMWVLILLGLISAGFVRDTRLGTNLARNIAENAKAEALADAGISRAILGLLDVNPLTGWRADGTPYRFAFGDGIAEIRLADESGKVDLNHAPPAILIGLLKAADVDADEARTLADAIRDFSDPDHDPRASGAEDPDYIAAGLAAGAKDASFDDTNELMQVLGMTREVYDAISRYITVHSGSSRINLLAAPDFVLSALPSLAPEQLKKIRADRAEGARLQRMPVDVVTVRVEARTRGGGVFVREAVLKRDSGAADPFKVLDWRQVWPKANVRDLGEPLLDSRSPEHG
jgi:general secretion pathway protein K